MKKMQKLLENLDSSISSKMKVERKYVCKFLTKEKLRSFWGSTVSKTHKEWLTFCETKYQQLAIEKADVSKFFQEVTMGNTI